MSLAIRRLDSRDAGFSEALTRLLAYAEEVDDEVEASVAAHADVGKDGFDRGLDRAIGLGRVREQCRQIGVEAGRRAVERTQR